MKSKLSYVILALLLLVSLGLSFGTGYALGSEASPGSGEGLDVVGQAWGIIFDEYVDRDQLDTGEMSQAAIEGMVAAIDDPYTAYLDAETYQLSSTSLEGGFSGIGAEVAVRGGFLTIIAPFPGTPAAEAGIKAGDIIIKIDGQPAAGMSLMEAVLKIRGPEGTKVRLLVLHQGEVGPVEMEITRAEIKVPSVFFEMRGEIAYLNITHFSQRTGDELPPALEGIVAAGATDIILDLRSNPGGNLGAVIDTTSCFLSEGIVLMVVDNTGEQTALEVRADKEVIDLPMVVLVDNYSASGSEVLAGALQDYGRATIAGRQTYGKGSVNILHQLKDGSGLYITTARWLTPSGRQIEGEGLSPDYELELTGEDAIKWAIGYLAEQE